MSVREIRVCDVCESENKGQPSWLVMSVINAPEEMGEIAYDICSWECLTRFVKSEDEGEENVAPETTAEAPQGGQRTPITDPAEQPRPNMTLAEAIAMGLAPNYDPLRDGPR